LRVREMTKERLLIPGPVELSPDVLLAMAEPIMGHRTKEFSEMLVECMEDMKYVFQTKKDVVLITGSGTAAMDAAVASTIEEGDEYVCITGGKFGDRFVKVVKSYGGVPKVVDVEWGKAVSIEDVEEVVNGCNARAITLTHNETSTGVLHDAEAIGKIAKESGCIFIMDGVTSVGGDDVRTDEWGVDICIVGSQKCLAAPPGLAMLSVSDYAWEIIENSPTKNFYLNLSSYKKSLEKDTTPFTPSVSLVYGLHRALKNLRREGLEKRIERHRTMAKAAREAAKAMNLELFADESHASNTVTSIKIPGNLTDDDIRGRMRREYGFVLAGGQDHVKGKIFRIGHMGNVDQKLLMEVLSALEDCLEKAGHAFEPGSGMRAAQEVFYKG